MEVLNLVETLGYKIDERKVERQPVFSFVFQQSAHINIGSHIIVWEFQAGKMLIEFPSVPGADVYLLIHGLHVI